MQHICIDDVQICIGPECNAQKILCKEPKCKQPHLSQKIDLKMTIMVFNDWQNRYKKLSEKLKLLNMPITNLMNQELDIRLEKNKRGIDIYSKLEQVGIVQKFIENLEDLTLKKQLNNSLSETQKLGMNWILQMITQKVENEIKYKKYEFLSNFNKLYLDQNKFFLENFNNNRQIIKNKLKKIIQLEKYTFSQNNHPVNDHNLTDINRGILNYTSKKLGNNYKSQIKFKIITLKQKILFGMTFLQNKNSLNKKRYHTGYFLSNSGDLIYNQEDFNKKTKFRINKNDQIRLVYEPYKSHQFGRLQFYCNQESEEIIIHNVLNRDFYFAVVYYKMRKTPLLCCMSKQQGDEVMIL